jgi:hypothetical protein
MTATFVAPRKYDQTLVFTLVLAVYLGAWSGLTAFGAVIFHFAPNTLWSFLGRPEPFGNVALGGTNYWLLLILPYMIVPPVMYISWVGSAILLNRWKKGVLFEVEVKPLPLFALAALSGVYCLSRLIETGHAVPGVLLTSGDYLQNIRERADIISREGFIFFAIIYAAIPVISSMFFSRLLAHFSVNDAIGFVATFILFYYLALSIYMKAPFMVYFVMLALTVVLMRTNWLWIIALVGLAFATLISMQMLMGGATISAPIPAEESTAETTQAIEAPSFNVPAVPDILKSSILRTPLNITFRMASSYPFYIGIFKNPEERCGVESRKIPFLPEWRCDLPSKVFKQMYPEVTEVVGMAPAAAHVSAYGEIGLGWSVTVLVAAGISLGALAALSSIFIGPLRVGLALAACVYAYYLTQVSFRGALTYAHGLIFYLMPLVVLAVVSRWKSHASNSGWRKDRAT